MQFTSEYEWNKIGRKVKPDAVPIIVLWPFGPIRFLYELADTEPDIDRAAFNDPFAVKGTLNPRAVAGLGAGLAKQRRFRIKIGPRRHGFNYAGSAASQGSLSVSEPISKPVRDGSRIAEFAVENVRTTICDPQRIDDDRVVRRIPSYRVTVNDRLDHREHIFCGHLGGCDGGGKNEEGGWPSRAALGRHEQEIEAESRIWSLRVLDLLPRRRNT
jgi:hypothetical protein